METQRIASRQRTKISIFGIPSVGPSISVSNSIMTLSTDFPDPTNGKQSRQNLRLVIKGHSKILYFGRFYIEKDPILVISHSIFVGERKPTYQYYRLMTKRGVCIQHNIVYRSFAAIIRLWHQHHKTSGTR